MCYRRGMSAARGRIEPGLLPLFRLFIALRLAFFGLSQCLWLVAPEERIQRFPILGLIETSVLLVYLTWGRLQERMGKAYLPVALLVASVGPIIEYRITVAVRRSEEHTF